MKGSSFVHLRRETGIERLPPGLTVSINPFVYLSVLVGRASFISWSLCVAAVYSYFVVCTADGCLSRGTRVPSCINIIQYIGFMFRLFLDLGTVWVRPRKPNLTAMGIRCADHATPSIRKSWH
jgi:hypothetical protein